MQLLIRMAICVSRANYLLISTHHGIGPATHRPGDAFFFQCKASCIGGGVVSLLRSNATRCKGCVHAHPFAYPACSLRRREGLALSVSRIRAAR